MMRTLFRENSFAVILLTLTGCNALVAGGMPQGVGAPSGGTPENRTEPVNALVTPGNPGLEACATAEVDADLDVAIAFDQSIHELVVCGGMATRLSVSFFDVLIDAALGNEPGSDDWVYVGDGQWETGEGMMNAWFILPFDTSWGSAGDVIPFDVLDTSNYFSGMSIVASASASTTGETSTELRIEFTDVQPGFELLGIEETPNGSVSIDFDRLVERLGAIVMRQDIVVEDDRGDVGVYYHVTSDGVPIRNLVFASGPSDMEIHGAFAEHRISGQRLEVTDWNMDYQGGSAGTLDGTLDVNVTGGTFDYEAHFSFPHRRYPDVSLGCL